MRTSTYCEHSLLIQNIFCSYATKDVVLTELGEWARTATVEVVSIDQVTTCFPLQAFKSNIYVQQTMWLN